MSTDRVFPLHFTHIDNLISRAPYGERSEIKASVWRILQEKRFGRDDSGQFRREVRKKTIRLITFDQLVQVYRALFGAPHARQHDLLNLLPADAEVRILETHAGDANQGEIEVISRGEELVPGNRYISGSVDTVRFWQGRDPESGEHIASHGTYLRFGTPGDQPGGAVLIVGANSGRVFLVTEFRHTTRTFRTEAVRGYGDKHDASARATSLRESKEEVGIGPYRYNDGRDSMIYLGSSFPDTGKLWDCPHLFLMVGDEEAQQNAARRSGALMQDPVWVEFETFYQAVFSCRPLIGLHTEQHFGFLMSGDDRERMRVLTALSDGVLDIRCGFTIQMALLSLPRLESFLGPGSTANLPKRLFDPKNYI